MDTTTDGPGQRGWTDVAVCTLPTAERPLRLAEFDDLFATSLHSIDRPDDTAVRLLLVGADGLAVRTRRLADAESACCSFFSFDVVRRDDGVVAFDIGVPPQHVEVLAGLVARAQAASSGSA